MLKYLYFILMKTQLAFLPFLIMTTNFYITHILPSFLKVGLKSTSPIQKFLYLFSAYFIARSHCK